MIISFHSLEDRIVKNSLRDAAQMGEDVVSALRTLHDVNATGFMIDAMCSRWLEVLVGITVDVR